MSRTAKSKRQVYAVIRIDHFYTSDTPLEHLITIKEIVSNLELAKAEVNRLNELNADKIGYLLLANDPFISGWPVGELSD